MSTLTLICALSENEVIGANNKLPWHLPNDLAHFKQHTLNKPIIMGRKTYESIGHPLPKRTNIVLTKNPHWQAQNVKTYSSLDQALLATNQAREIMIIGGSAIFSMAMPQADKMQLTFIHSEFEGDTFFPKWDKNDWHEIAKESFSADTMNPYDHTFVTLIRTINR